MGVQRGRGLRPYGVFLRQLLDELQSALAELENLEFHHEAEGSAEFQHYLRVATWTDEVTERVRHYDSAKVRKAWKAIQQQPPAESRQVDGPTNKLDARRRLTGGDSS